MLSAFMLLKLAKIWSLFWFLLWFRIDPQVSTVFAPGNVQGFTLVNRQRTNRITTGFSVELSTEGTQLSFTNFDHHSLEPHFWQLPSSYQGDKVQSSGFTLYECLFTPVNLVARFASFPFSSAGCFEFLPSFVLTIMRIILDFCGNKC